MVFHHPAPVGSRMTSGSGLRPTRMLQAFRELGYDVEEVAGFSGERRTAARAVVEQMDRGRTFDFVYSESVTMPTALSDPHHLPLHPLVDVSFFRSMRRGHVPVGLFYRDIHWRFDLYRKTVPLIRQMAARAFYRFDLAAYRRAVDVLFVPSLEMVPFIPGGHHHVEALPPGGRSDPSADATPTERPLKLLHVGGARPPLYDLDPALSVLRDEPDVRLILCCRPDEADAVRPVPDNCTVVHAEGGEVEQLYEQADISLLYYGPHPYRQFAVPVKLYESVAHGVPVIANRDTAAGRLVDRDGLGISVGAIDELRETLRNLARDPSGVDDLRAVVRAVRSEHTWAQRARTAASVLSGLRP